MINWSVEDNKIIYFEEPSFKFYEMLEDGMYKLNDEVELIEEQQDIDIQAIEELKPNTVFDTKETIRNHYNKINQLIQAVKQLDRKIREEE